MTCQNVQGRAIWVVNGLMIKRSRLIVTVRMPINTPRHGFHILSIPLINLLEIPRVFRLKGLL